MTSCTHPNPSCRPPVSAVAARLVELRNRVVAGESLNDMAPSPELQSTLPPVRTSSSRRSLQLRRPSLQAVSRRLSLGLRSSTSRSIVSELGSIDEKKKGKLAPTLYAARPVGRTGLASLLDIFPNMTSATQVPAPAAGTEAGPSSSGRSMPASRRSSFGACAPWGPQSVKI